jgi:hypothetical protein
MMYGYLFASMGCTLVWLVFYVRAAPQSRPVIVRLSALTALAGFAEPLFIPDYWNPPTLFDLGQRTGFDIESFLFNFSSGGNAVAIYAAIRSKAQRSLDKVLQADDRARHRLTLLVFPVAFFGLVVVTDINAVYIVMIAVAVGFLVTCMVRPDLMEPIIISGLLFTGLYFAICVTFNALYPGFLLNVWNLGVLSGVMFVGVPLEEILFAFAYGIVVACFAEHFFAPAGAKPAGAERLRRASD